MEWPWYCTTVQRISTFQMLFELKKNLKEKYDSYWNVCSILCVTINVKWWKRPIKTVVVPCRRRRSKRRNKEKKNVENTFESTMDSVYCIHCTCCFFPCSLWWIPRKGMQYIGCATSSFPWPLTKFRWKRNCQAKRTGKIKIKIKTMKIVWNWHWNYLNCLLHWKLLVEHHTVAIICWINTFAINYGCWFRNILNSH